MFFVFPQPLWSSPVYFFSSWLHALAKCFPVVFLIADLVELPDYLRCGCCILTDVLILDIYF